MMAEINNPVSKFEVSYCDLCNCGRAETVLRVCGACKASFKNSVVNGLTCLRCGHRWLPRRAPVRICPSCKSKLWRIPRKKKEVGV